MNKKKGIRKFGRVASQRRALMSGLITELFLRGKIKTTETRAKAMKGRAEKYITKAKKGDLSARRHLVRYLPEKVAKKVIEEIAHK